ncbi:MFS transporter [Spiribacter vilamensis]|uniref:Putative MFS family arabinose efflux permease n=1 Tax=Spiribacter vilamensis TaxID=531306 RepID=A0A4Q8D124_9GAMM|nr:MFS transporter [Spiribacter vilamensis]RZU99013.1 putative MFS family arabinose efflux permease [Spiribacter vilamensis]TVO61983.1 MFS transporter [Spiribacter vilamensis]
MLTVLRPLVRHRYLLAFAFLLAFLSGHGQTYFISLFGGEIRAAFELSNTEFGGLYSAATLTSGILVIALGRGVDRMPLGLFTAAVIVGAAAGGVLLATAPSAAWLLPGFLLLRLCGQGLMVHVAQTTVGRRVERGRGTAIGVVTVGLPAGEAVLPAMVVVLMATLGWRMSWGVFALVLVAVALPLALLFLRLTAGQPSVSDEASVAADGNTDKQPGPSTGPVNDWSRAQVLGDPRFYRIMPAILAPPFLITALFFHQVPIAEAKGWALGWLSTAFVLFALSHVVSLTVSGMLIDRLGAARLLRLYLAPILAALLVLGFVPGDPAALLYLGLAGLSVGTASTLMGAVWPELYGIRHLGAIRAMAHGAMVLSTAIAPLLIGALLDAGISLPALASALAGYVVVAMVVIPAPRTLRPRDPVVGPAG